MSIDNTKDFVAPEQIVNILKERGLEFKDEAKAIKYFLNIGYHRLSAYMYPFIRVPKQCMEFKKGTVFEDVLSLYRFDKKLRLLLFNELEKIEVAVRSVISIYACESTTDIFWITQGCHFADAHKFQATLSMIEKELSASKEDFIQNFHASSHTPYPPAWMVTEVLQFGNLNYIYSNIADNRLRKRISAYFGVQPKVFSSWLTALSNLRNMCCHHARTWNREFALSPAIPQKTAHPWINTSGIETRRLYYRICIVRYLLYTVSPSNTFKQKLLNLAAKYPQVDFSALGFPTNWQNEPMWL